jgi:hypothetical protein
MHYLPDVAFFDARRTPAGQMGLFPPGSNYQGMTVMPVLPAGQFLTDVAFPYAHPNAQGVRILQKRNLPNLAQSYQRRVLSAMPYLSFSYDAALMTVTYGEGGIPYEERMVTVVEDWGQLGAGMWSNKETFYIRAPAGEFEKWEPVFKIIQDSVQINPQWLSGEIRGQIQRGEIAAKTQQEIQRIDREIGEHRRKTNAEINKDMFLTLTDQEEYMNPFTHQVETGSNQWQHRWVNESGDVVYTDSESYDPNTDIDLNRTDYKKTPIRKRFPQ